MKPNIVARLKFAGLCIENGKIAARPGFNRYQLRMIEKDEIIAVLNKLRSEDENLIKKFREMSLWQHFTYWLRHKLSD